MKFMDILIVGLIILVIDSVYLSYFSDFFNKMIKEIQGSEINIKYSGAIACYIIMVLGLKYFILDEEKSIKDAFILGFLIYGVFEFTNYAIIDNWNVTAVIIDSIWGGILFSVTTWIYYYLKKQNI